MEFCADVAILQSAVQLADQKSCLKNFTKNSKPDVVRLLTDTIEEITKGIARPQLRKDADLKRLKLVAVLLCKVLSTENVNDESSEGDSENPGGSWLEGWEHVTYGFPHLGWQFVFDVVKASCLWQELFKLLPQLAQTSATQLLTGLLRYLQPCQDPVDAETMIHVLFYLSLHWKSPIFNKHHSELNLNQIPLAKSAQKNNTRTSFTEETLYQSLHCEQEYMYFAKAAGVRCLVSTLFDAVESANWEVVSGGMKAVAILSLNNLIVASCSGIASVLTTIDPERSSTIGPRHNKQGHNAMAVFVNIVSNSNERDDDVFRVLKSQIRDDDLPVISVKLDKFLEQENIRTTQKICDAILSSDDIAAFFNELDSFNPEVLFQGKYREIHQQLWTRLNRRLILDQHGAMENLTSHDDLTVTWPMKMRSFADHIHNATAEENSQWEVPLTRLVKAVQMLKYNLSGALDQLRWMLNTRDVDIVTQPSWLECLESTACRSFLTTQDQLVAVLHQLVWIKQQPCLPSEMVPRLQKLILSCFGEINTTTQNDILLNLCEVYTGSDLNRIFDVDSSLENHLRAALNRLTNDHLVISMPVLSVICIQSPLLVVRAVLQSAAHNRGQINVLVKVLQTLPALSRFGCDGENALVSALTNLILSDNQSISSAGEKNLASLSKHLLMPYQMDSTQPHQRPLITHCHLLEGFILPILLPSQNALHQDRNTPLGSRMFRVVIETMAELPSDWIDLLIEAKPLVLLSLILTRVENFLAPDDVDVQRDCGSELFARADWLECLAILVTTLEKCHTSLQDSEFRWLHDRLQLYHWTTRWHCYSLFCQVLGEGKFTVNIPEKMLDFVTVPGEPCQASDDGFLSLLQFVSVSDMTLNLAQSGIKDSTARMQSSIVLALTVMLPVNTAVELCRISRFIQHWLQHTTMNKSGALASENTAGVSSFQLLDLGLQLLVKTAGSDDCQHNWASIATAVAYTVKITILDVVAEETASNELCQCFIILSNMFSYWSDTDSAHHLLTLGLDLISQLDSSLQTWLKMTKSPARHCESDSTRLDFRVRGVVDVLLNNCQNISQTDIAEPLRKALCAISV